MHLSENIELADVKLVQFDLSFVNHVYLGWLKNDMVNKYLLKPRNNIDIVEAKKYCTDLITSDNNYFLGIIDNKLETHIGNVRVGPIDHNSKVCKFSMMIGDTAYHGRGIGSQVVSGCIEFAFLKLKMNKFYLDVIPDNIAAVRTYEKNDLVVEGRLRQHVFINGNYQDLLVMSILRSEY